MDTVTAPSVNSYEVAVQREMRIMAEKNGTLRAELIIVRCTLNAVLTYMEGDWRKEELRSAVTRIDLALESKPEQEKSS